jgi:putative Holliday junction resolvase
MNHRTYLGIDFGLRRIGLAKSDPTGLIASAYKTITYKSLNKALDEIVLEIEKNDIDAVVVGYPVAPNGGNEGERCRMVDDFIEQLKKKYDGEIILADERDSTNEAEKMIHAHDKKVGRDKARLDRIAAGVILQRFLDEQRRS